MISPDMFCLRNWLHKCSTAALDVWRCVEVQQSQRQICCMRHDAGTVCSINSHWGLFKHFNIRMLAWPQNCKMHCSSELITSLCQNEEVVTMFLNEAMESCPVRASRPFLLKHRHDPSGISCMFNLYKDLFSLHLPWSNKTTTSNVPEFNQWDISSTN